MQLFLKEFQFWWDKRKKTALSSKSRDVMMPCEKGQHLDRMGSVREMTLCSTSGNCSNTSECSSMPCGSSDISVCLAGSSGAFKNNMRIHTTVARAANLNSNMLPEQYNLCM